MCSGFFSKIDLLNERLSMLGREAKTVIGEMLNAGVPYDAVVPFLDKARKAERANVIEKATKVNENRKCK